MPRISFHWYGFVIGLAVIISLEVIKRLVKKDTDKKLIEDGLLPVLVGGIIGGRLYHVLDQFDFYRTNPQYILRIDQGGMGIFGAIVGGLIAAVLFLFFKKKLSRAKIIAVYVLTVLPLGQGIGRIGNYLNHELYGIATKLPWGMVDLSGTKRHPLFLYEMILDIILFLFLYFRPHKSQNIGLYLCGYGLIRLLLENYRELSDTWIYSGVSITKLVSVVMILTGLFFYYKYSPKKLQNR